MSNDLYLVYLIYDSIVILMNYYFDYNILIGVKMSCMFIRHAALWCKKDIFIIFGFRMW
jgi:hypothetical protein